VREFYLQKKMGDLMLRQAQHEDFFLPLTLSLSKGEEEP